MVELFWVIPQDSLPAAFLPECSFMSQLILKVLLFEGITCQPLLSFLHPLDNWKRGKGRGECGPLLAPDTAQQTQTIKVFRERREERKTWTRDLLLDFSPIVSRLSFPFLSTNERVLLTSDCCEEKKDNTSVS